MSFISLPPLAYATRHCSGFLRPPLHELRALPEIYDWHYSNNPSHPVFVHSDATGPNSFLSYSDVVPAIHRAGGLVAKVLRIGLDEADSDVTVAILANSDTITYFTTILGVLRLGIPVMPISPRFTAHIIAHLLHEAKVSHILANENILPLARAAVIEYQQNYNSSPIIIYEMPTFRELYQSSDNFNPLPPRKFDPSATTIIVHSSGSISYPKPIKWNGKRDFQTAVCPLFGAHDLCGAIFACHAIELYHGLGLCFPAWAGGTGLIMATFSPTSPPLLNPDVLFQALTFSNSMYAFASPAVIQSWARDPVKLLALSKLKVLAYAGSHLNKSVGDFLVRQGVKIYTVYGMSEAGNVCQIFPDDSGENWEYFEICRSSTTVFEPTGDGLFELIVVSNVTQELAVPNTKFDGRDAYATHDTFVPHPHKSGWWRILGRAVDQIMLSTGEVTSPGPLEEILCQHEAVKSAIMFGRNKPKHGFLVALKDDHIFDSQDDLSAEKYRDILEPQLDELNTFAKAHARVSKDMLIFTSPSKPFEFNSKGLPRRTVILHQYQEEIEHLYTSHGFRGPDRAHEQL